MLAAIRKALRSDGTFLMQDIKGHSKHHENGDVPLAPLLYTISTMHCMTVSLAQGGEGLGTVWGVELATEMLADANISTDGAPDTIGVLYGPGIIVQMPMVGPDDPVAQVMVTLDEEDMAWPVLTRLCRRLGWKMLDPESGRTFGG